MTITRADERGAWRACCSVMGTAGSGSGPRKRTGRKTGHRASGRLRKELHANGTIAVRLGTQVVAAHGSGRLERLTLHDARTGATETVPAAALFILIGAHPTPTGWPGRSSLMSAGLS
jgi:hypothetical protein